MDIIWENLHKSADWIIRTSTYSYISELYRGTIRGFGLLSTLGIDISMLNELVKHLLLSNL